MKKLLIIILLLTSVGYSQTKFGVSGSNTFIGDRVYPLRDATQLFSADSSFTWSPYNVMLNQTSDSIIMYFNRQGPYGAFTDALYFGISPITSGTTFTRRTLSYTAPLSYQDQAVSFITGTTWRSLLHVLDTTSTFYMYITTESTNRGYTWAFTAGRADTFYTGSKSVVANKKVGEDVTSFWLSDSSKYLMYFRDSTTQYVTGYTNQAPLRTIAMSRTTDMKTFTARSVVIPLTRSNFHNVNSKDYRISWNNMSVIKTATNEYWGFANVIKLPPNAREDYQFTVGTDYYTVQTRLYHSTDGSNWTCRNDSNAFIPIHDSVKQVFSVPVVVGTDVYIYCIENIGRHIYSGYANDWNDALQPTQKRWRVWRYVISVAGLRTHLP